LGNRKRNVGAHILGLYEGTELGLADKFTVFNKERSPSRVTNGKNLKPSDKAVIPEYL
jgi:hypothetical protein